MFDVGGGELILIVLAIIILFGPKKIPELMNMFGKGYRHVRSAQDSIRSEFDKIGKESINEVNKVKEVGKDVSEEIKIKPNNTKKSDKSN